MSLIAFLVIGIVVEAISMGAVCLLARFFNHLADAEYYKKRYHYDVCSMYVNARKGFAACVENYGDPHTCLQTID